MAKPKRNMADEMFELIKTNKSCSEDFIRTTLKLGSTNFRTNISKLLNNDTITRIGVGKTAEYVIQTCDPVQIVFDDIKANNLTSCTDIMSRCVLTRLQILKAVETLLHQNKIFRFKISTSNSLRYSIFSKNNGARSMEIELEDRTGTIGSTTFETTIDKTYLKAFLRGEMHLVGG